MKCPMYDSCTLRNGGCVASLPDNGCYWYRWFKDLIQKTENPWHTGTPTDRNGLFLIQTKGKNYFIVKWQDGFWGDINGDDCLEDEDIVKWQKIEEN